MEDVLVGDSSGSMGESLGFSRRIAERLLSSLLCALTGLLCCALDVRDILLGVSLTRFPPGVMQLYLSLHPC